MKGKDAIDSICADLVAAIEAGAGGWRMPWHHTGAGTLPTNVTTRAPYRGGNWLQLMHGQLVAGYPTAWWATYKQFAAAGGQVRKGEHGVPCVFWSRLERVDEATGLVGSRMVPNGFTVFNVAQQDGFVAPLPDVELDVVDVDEQLAAWFATVPATIVVGEPAYYPSLDRVSMPPTAAFHDEIAYFGTLAHELAHWTGHDNRCKRDLTGRFGTESYAFEELVAEMSAAFTTGLLGIPTVDRRHDHAAYLRSWLSVLKKQPSLLWQVASFAQKATDHLFTYQPTEEEPCLIPELTTLPT